MTARRTAACVGLSMVGIVAAGCEGLGRELVDEQRGGELAESCPPPIACSASDLVGTPITGVPPSPTVGLHCADPNRDVRTGPGPHDALGCYRWELAVEGELVLPSVRADSLELVISAQQPARVTFQSALLSSTRIALRGPVSLRFEARSSLSNVHVFDETPTTPSVSIVESEALSFVLAGDEERFDGELIVTRGRLRDASIMAAHVTLENTLVQTSAIAADRLVAHAIECNTLRLQVGRAAIASADCTGFRVERCDAVQITASVLNTASLAPCAEPLRIDRTSLYGGTAAGRIESKLTTWRDVVFAGGLETDLELWLGSVAESTFCGGTRRIATDARTRCNDCSALGAAAAQVSCMPRMFLEDASAPESSEPFNPDCPALDMLPPCMPTPLDEFPF